MPSGTTGAVNHGTRCEPRLRRRGTWRHPPAGPRGGRGGGGRGGRPATDFKIPAIVVAAEPNPGAGGPEVHLDTVESLVGILPALTPDGEGPPGRHQPRRPPPPPGSQAVLEPAPQARQWLGQGEIGRAASRGRGEISV